MGCCEYFDHRPQTEGLLSLGTWVGTGSGGRPLDSSPLDVFCHRVKFASLALDRTVGARSWRVLKTLGFCLAAPLLGLGVT